MRILWIECISMARVSRMEADPAYFLIRNCVRTLNVANTKGHRERKRVRCDLRVRRRSTEETRLIPTKLLLVRPTAVPDVCDEIGWDGYLESLEKPKAVWDRLQMNEKCKSCPY